MTAVCVAAFVLYFATLPVPRPPRFLGILPGLAVATFAGSWLAWWGRKRGFTLKIEAKPTMLLLDAPTRREELVDRALPFGAMLVSDPRSGHRVLVLSQHHEPVMILDPHRGASPVHLWNQRTVSMDLSGVAISPASAHVLTLAGTHTVEPLLATLENDLNADAPWLLYPLPSGETLIAMRDEIRVGRRVAPVGAGTVARKITVQTASGDMMGLSILAGQTTLLFACQDPSEGVDTSGSDAPDAFLPPVIFAVIASRFGLDGSAAPPPAKAYRG